MQRESRVAAFESGKLRLLGGDSGGHEIVLALPLNRLIARILRVPAGEDPVVHATGVLQAMSPFPDEPLTVSCEVVNATERETVVLAAALPESAADDIGEALDAAKLNVVRIDALALGQLRGMWNAIGGGEKRRLVLIKTEDCISAFVLDGELPVALRAVSADCDLRREMILLLLEAEDFGGAHELAEIVTVGAPDVSALASLARARNIEVGEDAALVGVLERAADPEGLDARPASWREMLDETRFKAKLMRNLSIAGGIWVLIMGVLFGTPIVYGFMTDYQKGLSRDHKKQYAAVREMKEKTDIVRKYSDHARGALEIMKAVSDRLPGGIELSSWNFKRLEGVSVAGEATDSQAVYDFKDAIAEMGQEKDADGELMGEAVFPSVSLRGPSASKNGQRFDLECLYVTEEDQ